MKEVIFTVFLNYKEESEEAKDDRIEILWANKEGLKILRTLFRVIKSEMSEFVHMMRSEAKSDFDKYVEIIAGNFGVFRESVNRYDFNERILKRIKKLKQFHFRSGGLTIHFDEIVEKIKALRFSRIKFWENLHRDFTENEDFYISKIEQRKEKEKNFYLSR